MGPDQRIDVSEFEQLAITICSRPGMYVHPATFGAVCAYLAGFDRARSGGPLIGFKQWLVVRGNTGNNLPWESLALRQLVEDPSDAHLPDEERTIRALGGLLNEFFEFRRVNELTKIFHDYARWLLRRNWYTGPLRRGQK